MQISLAQLQAVPKRPFHCKQWIRFKCHLEPSHLGHTHEIVSVGKPSGVVYRFPNTYRNSFEIVHFPHFVIRTLPPREVTQPIAASLLSILCGKIYSSGESCSLDVYTLHCSWSISLTHLNSPRDKVEQKNQGSP